MKETNPLRWPGGWPRMLIDDRVDRNAWKLSRFQYTERLEKELVRMKVRDAVLTMNVGDGRKDPRDPSVAVYFIRKQEEGDFSWQVLLGIDNPDPSLAEIEDKFRVKLRQYHSDIPGQGDVDMHRKLNAARQAAKDFISGAANRENQLCIACDRYTEVRWNIAAIVTAISYLRRLEDVGVSGILDRAFAGFRAELTDGVQHGVTTAA